MRLVLVHVRASAGVAFFPFRGGPLPSNENLGMEAGDSALLLSLVGRDSK